MYDPRCQSCQRIVPGEFGLALVGQEELLASVDPDSVDMTATTPQTKG